MVFHAIFVIFALFFIGIVCLSLVIWFVSRRMSQDNGSPTQDWFCCASLKGASKIIKIGVAVSALSGPLTEYAHTATIKQTIEVPNVVEPYALIEEKIHKYALKSQCYDVFGGVLDLSDESKMSKFDLKIGKLMCNTLSNLKRGKNNDFRDWAQIKTFTENFQEILQLSKHNTITINK